MIIDYSLDVFKDACVSDKEIKILSVVIASGMANGNLKRNQELKLT